MNEAIEQVKATFLDDVFVVPQDEIIHRIDYKGSRYYAKMIDGKPVLKPSVTSIIGKYHPMSPYLLKWYCDLGYEKAKAILEEKALYGTFCHILWAKLLLKYNIDLSEAGIKQEIANLFEKEQKEFIYDFKEWHKLIKQDMIGFVQWVQDYKIKPWFIELTLHGDTHSGTIDLGCQATFKVYNKSTKIYDLIVKNILVDWKSGRKGFYDSYAIQLLGYFVLVNTKFRNTHFSEIWSYGCKEFNLPIGSSVTPYEFKNQTDNPACNKWKHYLAMQMEDEPKVELPEKSEIQEIIINIETDINSCIKTVNLLDFLEDENAEEPRS